ncbi:hypothetical protein T07_9939, partial [Trichinella nelsoni]
TPSTISSHYKIEKQDSGNVSPIHCKEKQNGNAQSANCLPVTKTYFCFSGDHNLKIEKTRKKWKKEEIRSPAQKKILRGQGIGRRKENGRYGQEVGIHCKKNGNAQSVNCHPVTKSNIYANYLRYGILDVPAETDCSGITSVNKFLSRSQDREEKGTKEDICSPGKENILTG